MSRSRSRSSSYTLHQWSSRTLAGRRAPETQTSLCISDTNCNEFDVPAQVGDSIKTVKSYIHDKTSIPEDQIELWWRGTLLEDDRILTDIQITLDLNVVFRVIVQAISGEEWMVTTEANECVVGLKQAIQKVTEIWSSAETGFRHNCARKSSYPVRLWCTQSVSRDTGEAA